MIWAGDSGTILFSYSSRCHNRAHSYDHTLAKAHTIAGAGDSCPDAAPRTWWILGHLVGLATPEIEWHSVWPVLYVINTYCYILLSELLLLLLHCYYKIITYYYITHYYVLLLFLLLHCYYIIITYYYIIYYYILLHFIITLLLHHYYALLKDHYYLLLRQHYHLLLHHYYVIITSLLSHYSQFQKQVIMSSFLRIMHFLFLHYYFVITHYYHYYQLLHVTKGATCRYYQCRAWARERSFKRPTFFSVQEITQPVKWLWGSTIAIITAHAPDQLDPTPSAQNSGSQIFMLRVETLSASHILLH